MKALAAAAVALVSLSGCEKPAVSTAKEQVAASLRDPSSAQFRNVRASKFSEAQICGEVNGKNAFGAYAGYERFIVAKGQVFMAGEPDSADPTFDALWSGSC